MPVDVEQFSSEIEELKQEILSQSSAETEGQDAIILEVIQVLQEEMAKRSGKTKEMDLQSEVRFLAYLNLFTTLMDDAFDENDDSMYEEDEDEFEDLDDDEEYEFIDEDEE